MKQTLAALLLSLGPTLAFAQSSQPAAPPPAQKPWWERITFFADFRARYEGAFLEGVETRHRERFRLRGGMRTNITDQVGLTLRLASGEPTDIISTNQSLTAFWSRKPLFIDQAFVNWAPKVAPGLALGFGKYAYPVTRTQLVWDDDLNWEGTYEQYAKTIDKTLTVRFAAAQSPINEVALDDDGFLWAEQVQVGTSFGAQQVQVSAASYLFQRIDQLAVALARRELIGPTSTNATTTAADGTVNGYLSDFHIIDLIAHATLDTGMAQYPVQLVAEWASNTRAATDRDSAIWLVGTIGRAAAPRTAGLSYTYTRIEQDAVLSAFRYSDMPGTNIIGHQISASYMPVNRLNLDTALIFSRLLDPPGGIANHWLTRLQVDARVAF
jgi:hypothetical protein